MDLMQAELSSQFSQQKELADAEARSESIRHNMSALNPDDSIDSVKI